MKIINPSQITLPAELLEQEFQALYFTAPNAGAGTSTCVMAIAQQLCQSYSRKVVIVDGNPHSSSLTQKLQLNSFPGFFDWNLGGDVPRLVPVPVENELFYIVPTGIVEKGSNITSQRERCTSCLEQLKNNFDTVLFDAPAVFSNSANLMLALLFDGALLVVDSNGTRKEVAKSTKQKLSNMDVKIIGTIFNRRKYYIPQWLYHLL